MVLLAGRSRGWRVRHPFHFALQEPGDREAGGGARAPKAAARAASLAAPPARAVAALPCPSPRHCPVVRAFPANGARGIRRREALGWSRENLASGKARPGPDPGARLRGGRRRGSNTLLALGPARCLVRGELCRGRLVGAGPRALSWDYEILDFNQQFPSVDETEQVSDFGRIDSAGTIGLRSCPVLSVPVDRVGADIARRLGRGQTLSDRGRGPRIDRQPATVIVALLSANI